MAYTNTSESAQDDCSIMGLNGVLTDIFILNKNVLSTEEYAKRFALAYAKAFIKEHEKDKYFCSAPGKEGWETGLGYAESGNWHRLRAAFLQYSAAHYIQASKTFSIEYYIDCCECADALFEIARGLE